MPDTKKNELTKTRKHRTILIISSGLVVISAIAVCVICKRASIPHVNQTIDIPTNLGLNTFTSCSSSIDYEVEPVLQTISRAQHIRNLPEGWRASSRKIEQAINMGIELKANQTIVDSCEVTRRIHGN